MCCLAKKLKISSHLLAYILNTLQEYLVTSLSKDMLLLSFCFIGMKGGAYKERNGSAFKQNHFSRLFSKHCIQEVVNQRQHLRLCWLCHLGLGGCIAKPYLVGMVLFPREFSCLSQKGNNKDHWQHGRARNPGIRIVTEEIQPGEVTAVQDLGVQCGIPSTQHHVPLRTYHMDLGTEMCR